MQSHAGQRVIRIAPGTNKSQARHRSHPRDNRPTNGAYLGDVTSAVGRQRFSRFVARVLEDARSRGMTDVEIAKVSGVGASTFHRWRRGEFREAPELDRVLSFCRGLGVQTSEALAALGLGERRESLAPEPPMDPNVRTILRALADPNVSPEDKRVIRELLAMIARQHRRGRERREDAG